MDLTASGRQKFKSSWTFWQTEIFDYESAGYRGHWIYWGKCCQSSNKERVCGSGVTAPNSPHLAIADLPVELAYGDLTDPPSLERAVHSCSALIHTAAVYALWTPDPAAVYATNVEGTRNILKAV